MRSAAISPSCLVRVLFWDGRTPVLGRSDDTVQVGRNILY
jgi:hypothetical protein